MFEFLIKVLCVVALLMLLLRVAFWFLMKGFSWFGFLFKAFLPLGLVLFAIWVMVHPFTHRRR